MRNLGKVFVTSVLPSFERDHRRRRGRFTSDRAVSGEIFRRSARAPAFPGTQANQSAASGRAVVGVPGQETDANGVSASHQPKSIMLDFITKFDPVGGRPAGVGRYGSIRSQEGEHATCPPI